MKSASARVKGTTRIGLLFAGISAVLGGLVGLAYDPLIGVLLMLGGMALEISSVCELLREPMVRETASPADDR